MPRCKSNARELPKPRKIRVKPQVRLIRIKDDKMSPGWIVAAAEWRNEG